MCCIAIARPEQHMYYCSLIVPLVPVIEWHLPIIIQLTELTPVPFIAVAALTNKAVGIAVTCYTPSTVQAWVS